MPGAKSDLMKKIEKSWSALDALVKRLGMEQLSHPKDREGWAVKDHLIHIAVWEDSVSALFQGKARHQALGVDESIYVEGSIDEMNRRIYEQSKDVPPASAAEGLAKSHAILMGFVDGISEADLAREVREIFPSASPGERRRVLDIIDENTAQHFDEHRAWIEALLASG